jgi:hypothetical protein
LYLCILEFDDKNEFYLSKSRKAKKQNHDRFTFFEREIGGEISVAISIYCWGFWGEYAN